jgi:hypothetical protein
LDGDGRIDSQTDTDGDGYLDVYDFENGGDLIADLDTDGDGVVNRLDLDSDNDGIPDVVESGGLDANNDGLIDSYSDSDNDGYSDQVDGDAGNDGTAENTSNSLIITGNDTDSDGKPNAYPRANLDGTGLPNAYDIDADDDGIVDTREAGIADTDKNGIADGTLGADGWSDSVDGLSSLNLPNFDSFGNPDYLDMDTDDDGIPDNIEGQMTSAYVAPDGSDSDGDGLDDAYDNDDASFGGLSNNGITPTDTEFDGLPDYMDLDSDDDNLGDRSEGWDTDGSGFIDNGETQYTGTSDSDGDGLLDEYDNNDAAPNPTNGTTAVSYPDNYQPGDDRDWREEDDDSSVLPVNLYEQSLELTSEGVLINWSTLSEINNSHFIIERSSDAITFETIAKNSRFRELK